jgi:hypothetical protein
VTTSAAPDAPQPRSPLQRFVLGLLVVVALAAAAWMTQAEFILVTDEQNGEFPVSPFSLREDDFHHPRLELLRRRERLDDVVAGARTQFETIVRLRAWARRQWESGADFYYPPWDAVEILDLARQHDNRGFCAQYAVVFLQACQSLGIHARYVDLPGHFTVAVWSDDYDRWVAMDPTNDIHFERDGLPLRGRDLYRAYWEDNVRGIVEVDSRLNRKAIARADLSDYRLYSIGLSANQLSRPVEVRINGESRTLTCAPDYRTYPKIGRDEVVVAADFLSWRAKEFGASMPERPETTDPDDFRESLNQTTLLPATERVRDRFMKVVLLKNNSPTFKDFLVRSDESVDWIAAPSPTIKWLLHPGMNRLSARVETSFGWRGQVSGISLFYKPPLFPSLRLFKRNFVKLQWHQSG